MKLSCHVRAGGAYDGCAMNGAAGLLLFVVVACFAIMFSVMRYDKGRQLLEDWARDNGYTLIECQRRTLFRGPYFLTTSKSQLVYQIVVEDAAGVRRSGYARVGGYMLGMLSDKVDVTLGSLTRQSQLFDL